MLRCCIVCIAGESLDILLSYRKDWKKQHKQICKLLNVGHGDMQVRNDTHTNNSNAVNGLFENYEQRSLDEDGKRFFKLFRESTQDGSRAAARKMKKIARRHTKEYQTFLFFKA
jgi:hypothetical protein